MNPTPPYIERIDKIIGIVAKYHYAADGERVVNRVREEILKLIEEGRQEGAEEKMEAVVEEIGQFWQRMSTLYGGKLPFKFFGGGTEEEKAFLAYREAINDVIKLITAREEKQEDRLTRKT